jgi:hypothetical protein
MENNEINYDYLSLRNGYRKKNILNSKLISKIYNQASEHECLNGNKRVYRLAKNRINQNINDVLLSLNKMVPNKKKRSKYYGLKSKNIGTMADEVNEYLLEISNQPRLTNQISKMDTELFGESPVNQNCISKLTNVPGIIYNKNAPGFAASTFSSEQHHSSSRPSSQSSSRPSSQSSSRPSSQSSSRPSSRSYGGAKKRSTKKKSTKKKSTKKKSTTKKSVKK